MVRDNVVLDTNSIVASLSKKSPFHNIWTGLRQGSFILWVTNDILWEYQEIIAMKTNSKIAWNIIQFLINCEYVKKNDPTFHFKLIEHDPDDNKFVDCAIAANASFIVSDDSHFRILNYIPFPKVEVVSISAFSEYLKDLQ